MRPLRLSFLLPPRAHAQLVLEHGDLTSKLEVYEIEDIVDDRGRNNMWTGQAAACNMRKWMLNPPSYYGVVTGSILPG